LDPFAKREKERERRKDAEKGRVFNEIQFSRRRLEREKERKKERKKERREQRTLHLT
tara:strand:+ start:739 stop:909 length:171 start_codon:yes stop_codon:yes gene_type:complete